MFFIYFFIIFMYLYYCRIDKNLLVWYYVLLYRNKLIYGRCTTLQGYIIRKKEQRKMRYTDNETLIKEFKKLLIDNGIKQQFIADKLEISKQSLNLLMNKKHITFDDMQKLLACISYELRFEFVPVENDKK